MFRVKRLIRTCALVWIVMGMVAFSTTESVFAQEVPQQVIIEVKGSTEADDYFCWSPVPARMRLAVPVPTPVVVNLSGTSQAEGGAVWFQADNGVRPTPATFSPTVGISLTLPGDGTWVNFWIAGNPDSRASSGGKDVTVVATDEVGNELGTLPVMVRVRKNADSLNSVEIAQFLEALEEVHNLQNNAVDSPFNNYASAHAQAFFIGIHRGAPLFLAWHRAFVMDLERELQKVDARVALPYWRFDQPSENIFTPEFMGSVRGGDAAATIPGGFEVVFSPTNPLYRWRMQGDDEILTRVSDGTSGTSVRPSTLQSLFDNPDNAQYSSINRRIEQRYHNGPHCDIGGWLCDLDSPSDPLFFLLHANVDRAWAQWQAEFNRFNPADPAAYSAQDTFAAASSASATPLFRKGSYAQDLMWPWNGEGGDQGTADDMDDWPDFSYPMPTVAGAEGPVLPPTPADMVDYLDLTGQGDPHGACYDDIDYYGNPIGDGS